MINLLSLKMIILREDDMRKYYLNFQMEKLPIMSSRTCFGISLLSVIYFLDGLLFCPVNNASVTQNNPIFLICETVIKIEY